MPMERGIGVRFICRNRLKEANAICACHRRARGQLHPGAARHACRSNHHAPSRMTTSHCSRPAFASCGHPNDPLRDADEFTPCRVPEDVSPKTQQCPDPAALTANQGWPVSSCWFRQPGTSPLPLADNYPSLAHNESMKHERRTQAATRSHKLVDNHRHNCTSGPVSNLRPRLLEIKNSPLFAL
jgi:hypothetical protein